MPIEGNKEVQVSVSEDNKAVETSFFNLSLNHIKFLVSTSERTGFSPSVIIQKLISKEIWLEEEMLKRKRTTFDIRDKSFKGLVSE